MNQASKWLKETVMVRRWFLFAGALVAFLVGLRVG